MERVGFIGLGMMGRPMAENLHAKGVPLVTCDAAGVALPGVPAEAAPEAVARAARTVILMLPDSGAVAAVME
ncbi:MAG: NAD(P)-binding domain-containing protein, partial [Roseococcus sp.]